MIIKQQGEANFQQNYELHCSDALSIQEGKLSQFSKKRKKGEFIGMYHQIEKAACLNRLMMAVASSERFSDPESYGALTLKNLLTKVCEAESRDTARQGKSESKAQVEISFNHIQVNEMATDLQHHKEKMVRQAETAKAKKDGQTDGSNGKSHVNDYKDQRNLLSKCLFCNGSDHVVRSCPKRRYP